MYLLEINKVIIGLLDYSNYLNSYSDDTLVANEVVPVSLSNQGADFNVLITVPPALYSITLLAENENGQGMLSEPYNISLILSSKYINIH